jgi:hypothetical protein
LKAKKHAARIYDAILEPNLSITPAMARALRGCVSPASVAYYLRAHPEIAEKISGMGKARVEREIDAIADAWERVDDEICEGIDRHASLWF